MILMTFHVKDFVICLGILHFVGKKMKLFETILLRRFQIWNDEKYIRCNNRLKFTLIMVINILVLWHEKFYFHFLK